MVQWDGKSPKAKLIRIVLEAENCTEYETNIFDDSHADPYGRLFVGSRRTEICADLDMPTYGSLFRISKDEPNFDQTKPIFLF